MSVFGCVPLSFSCSLYTAVTERGFQVVQYTGFHPEVYEAQEPVGSIQCTGVADSEESISDHYFRHMLWPDTYTREPEGGKALNQSGYASKVLGTLSLQDAALILSTVKCAVVAELATGNTERVVFPAVNVLSCMCDDELVALVGGKCPATAEIFELLERAGGTRIRASERYDDGEVDGK